MPEIGAVIAVSKRPGACLHAGYSLVGETANNGSNKHRSSIKLGKGSDTIRERDVYFRQSA